MTRNVGGFTLIEILLAITLLAMLLAGAYAGIRTATRAAAAGEAQIERTNKLRVTQEFLRRELSQTLAIAFEKDSSGRGRLFDGQSEQLTFVGPMPGFLGHGGPYVQQLRLESDGSGRKLTFRHAMRNGYDAEKHGKVDDEKPVVLLEGIYNAEFSYRGLDETGKFGEWKSEWDRAGTTPLLVRLKLEYERGDRRSWPELVIPLMLDTSAAGASSGVVDFGPRGF